MGPGTKCNGYLECVKLIRAGTAVDYSGVTGEMDYTDTGVVSGIYGIFKWTSLSNRFGDDARRRRRVRAREVEPG